MSLNTMKKRIAIVLFVCAGGAVLPVSAHVLLEYQVAPAGKRYKASFQVGHGCGASPTRQIAVDIPAAMHGARPMSKPGWAIEVQRGALAQPYTRQGRSVSEDVLRVIWTAQSAQDMLPSAQYDEFVLVAQAPEQPGTLYWPVRQVCAQGRNDWVELPRAGQKLFELEFPAAALEILPSAGGAAHGQ